MAVIIKYVVERDGVEVKVFSERKEAEAFDKILDASDALSEMILKAGIEFDDDTKIDKKLIDSITYYLAQNGPEVVTILKGIKPVSSAPKTAKQKTETESTTKKQAKKP
jgi:hypothetical protein